MELFNIITAAEGHITVLLVTRILVLAFLAILFLQSGLDKVFDYSGNLQWLIGHFQNSPLKNTVTLNLWIITFLEIIAGGLCAIGIAEVLFFNTNALALTGVTLSALSVLCLFFGQRLAKDYVGAAVLVNYFILCIFGLLIFAI